MNHFGLAPQQLAQQLGHKDPLHRTVEGPRGHGEDFLQMPRCQNDQCLQTLADIGWFNIESSKITILRPLSVS